MSFSFALTAQAGIVEADFKVEGDGKAFIDTLSGTEWLDLTVTQGKSINDVLAETSYGGLYSGFRVASLADMQSLTDGISSHVLSYSISNRSAPNVFTNKSSSIQIGCGTIGPSSTCGSWSIKSKEIMQSMGPTYYTSGSRRSMFIFGMSIEDGDTYFNRTEMRVTSPYTLEIDDPRVSGTFSYVNQNHGVYLVSDGGNTLSSQLAPELMINNPDAPVNDVSYNSMLPVTLSLGLLSCGLISFRRKK